MKTFELASKLAPRRPNEQQLKYAKDRLDNREWIFPAPANQYDCSGFIKYIAYCHNNHFGAVINPTDIWYMVLSEIATSVKANPTAFESLFTKTPGKKQDIIVLTGNVKEINPMAVVHALKSRVPTDVNLFLPQFSTDTIAAVMAMNIAFCDMVSPYYNYMTCLCGIPYIQIGGEIEDWELMKKSAPETF